MPTIRDSATRAALHSRFDRLTPELTPAWGTMTAAQMLAHLTDAARMAAAELPVASKDKPLMRTWIFKKLFFHVVTFPKSAPTATELVARTPDPWSIELVSAKSWVDRLGTAPSDARWAAHPLFGRLTGEEWGILAHKHIDHHLRQFGV